MAEMKKFTIEGDASLGYSTEGGRCIRIDDEKLAEIIGQKFEFPNDDEWEAMYQRLEGLREQGLMPADGEPDVERTGMRLRITVEIIE